MAQKHFLSLCKQRFAVIFLLLFISQNVSCFTQTSNFIRDLETNSQSRFINEAASWISSVTLSNSVKYYNCGGNFVLGGYNWSPGSVQSGKTLSKQFTGLPTHTVVKYSFLFWAIDSWDWDSTNHDKFQIQFDNLPLIEGYGITFQSSSTSLCGGNWRDIPSIKVTGWIAHSALTLNLKFIVYFNDDSNNESLGIRDIELNFANDNPGANSICAYSAVSATFQNQAICVCETGKYSPTGLSSGCTSCTTGCASCYAAGTDKCIGCADGYYFDGTRCSACHSSCTRCTGPGINACTKCSSGTAALFNGRCISASRCSSPPFTMLSAPDECVSPCSLATFASWDKSCYPPCPNFGISDLNGACQGCTSWTTQYLQATVTGYQFAFQLSPSLCDPTLENVRRFLTVTEHTPGSVTSYSYQVTKTSPNNYLIDFTVDPLYLENASFDLTLSSFTASLAIPKLCSSLNPQYLQATNVGYQWTLQLLSSSCDLSIDDFRNSLAVAEHTPGSVTSFSYQVTKTAANNYLIDFVVNPLLSDGVSFDISWRYLTASLVVPKLCTSLTPQYLKAEDDGYQWTFELLPSSCDLSIDNVRNFLTVTEHVPGSLTSYSYQVTKTASNNYLIDFIVSPLLLENFSFDVSLSYLTTSLVVPKLCASLDPQYLKAKDDGYQWTFQLLPSSCDLSIDNVRSFLTVTEHTPGSVNSFSFVVTKTAANNYLIDFVVDPLLLEAASFDLSLSSLTASLAVPKICTALSTQYLKATSSGYQYSLTLSPSTCDLSIANVIKYLTITEATLGSVPSYSYVLTKTSANNYLIDMSLDLTVIEAVPFDVRLRYVIGSLNVARRFSTICKSLSTQYLRATDEGHQYTMQLSPSSCDLSIDNVKRYLVLTEAVPNSIGTFSFRVTRTSANNYLISLVLDQSTLEDASIDVQLSFMTDSLNVPKKFVLDGGLKALAGAVPTITTGFSGMLGGSFASTMALGATAGLWSIVSFQQFVGYFLFINVEYPPILELFFSMLQISFWDLLPNPLAALTESLSADIIAQDKMAVTPYDPPVKFVKYEMSSFFIENGGAIIAINLFVLLLLGHVLLLKKITALKNNFILVKLKVWIKWNLFARIFLENAIPLSLAVFLQLRISTFNHSYLIMCFVSAIISLLFIGIFVFFFLKILLNRDNEHLNKKMTKRMIGTLYEGIVLSPTKVFSKYYNVIILLRGIFLMCLITFFETSPVVQIFPLIIFNTVLVIYMLKQVRFESKKLDFIIKLKESLVLVGEIGMLLLCFKVDSEDYYTMLGYVIVGSLGTALFVEVGYMIILQICEIKNLWRKIKAGWSWIKNWKNRKANNKVEKIKMKRAHRFSSADLSQSSSELMTTNLS